MCSTNDSSNTVAARPTALPKPAGAAELRGQVGHRYRGRRELLAVQCLAEHLAQLGELMIVDDVAEFNDALIHPAGLGDDDHQQPSRRQRDHFQMANGRGRQRRVLHHRHLAGQLSEQPHRTPQHVVEVDTGLQEALDRAPFSRRERLDVVDAVDELAVALFRGHPPGAGMRLGDVALGLQHRHVVADGRAGDAQVVTLDQGFRTDRLLRGHKVGHDCAQYLETTVVGTAHRLFTSWITFILWSQKAPTDAAAVRPSDSSLELRFSPRFKLACPA